MKFKMAPKFELEEVDKNEEFSLDIATHLPWVANFVALSVIWKLYLVFLVS